MFINDKSTTGTSWEKEIAWLGSDPLFFQNQDDAKDPAHYQFSWRGEMSGGSEYDTGGEDCYQVEKLLHAPANILIMSRRIRACGIIFFLIIDIIFFIQGADS